MFHDSLNVFYEYMMHASAFLRFFKVGAVTFSSAFHFIFITDKTALIL